MSHLVKLTFEFCTSSIIFQILSIIIIILFIQMEKSGTIPVKKENGRKSKVMITLWPWAKSVKKVYHFPRMLSPFQFGLHCPRQ